MIKVFTDNRQARHNFHIYETYEAGIVLKGSEVKSIRNGKSALKDGYAVIDKGELFLINVHVSPYEKASEKDYNPERKRKLLLHRSEIKKVTGRIQERGLTLVPLQLYLKNGKIKVSLGLAKGKRKRDKREDIKKREVNREIRRTLKR